MSIISSVQNLPQELRLPLLEFAEAVEQNLRDKLAVRPEDIMTMQTVLLDFAGRQNRDEQRMDRLETALVELAEAQRRTEERLGGLVEAQRRTEERLGELAEAQRRTEETLNKLIARVDRIEVRLGGLVGDNLERKYREKAFSYFGQILRPVHPVSLQDLLPQLEAQLSESEVDELLPLDLLLRGRARQLADRPEVWLALEVSAVVDDADVERAARRARLLRKAGLPTAAAVAGEEVTKDAAQLALQRKVLLLQDGQRFNWREALSVALEPAADG